MVKYFFIAMVGLSLASCRREATISLNDMKKASTDSTVLSLSDFTLKSIAVGPVITNKPLSSQFVDNGDGGRYCLLDRETIYFFDWKTGLLIDSVKFTDTGRLNNYSGFNVISRDTVLVYNYSRKTLMMANGDGRLLTKWESDDKDRRWPDFEAINSTRIIYADNRIIMSGGRLGDLQEADAKHNAVSVMMQKERPFKKKVIMDYPCIYSEGNWGGVYMNNVYHDIAQSRYVYYSFPIDHYVYRYDLQTGKVSKFYMGSRYVKDIKSCTDNFMTAFTDKSVREKYYIGEHSYSMIMYDRYRNIMLRVVEHPLAKVADNGTFAKPFSIIISDMNGKLLSESTMFDDADMFDIYNMHIVKEGLAIALIDRRNENEIKFRCFNINL